MLIHVKHCSHRRQLARRLSKPKETLRNLRKLQFGMFGYFRSPYATQIYFVFKF